MSVNSILGGGDSWPIWHKGLCLLKNLNNVILQGPTLEDFEWSSIAACSACELLKKNRKHKWAHLNQSCFSRSTSLKLQNQLMPKESHEFSLSNWCPLPRVSRELRRGFIPYSSISWHWNEILLRSCTKSAYKLKQPEKRNTILVSKKSRGFDPCILPQPQVRRKRLQVSQTAGLSDLQTSTSSFNFQHQIQASTSSFTFQLIFQGFNFQLQHEIFKFKLQVQASISSFNFKLQLPALISSFNFNLKGFNFKRQLQAWTQDSASRLKLQASNSSIRFKLQLQCFKFKLQLKGFTSQLQRQASTSRFNFQLQLQASTSSFNFQLKTLTSSFNFKLVN